MVFPPRHSKAPLRSFVFEGFGGNLRGARRQLRPHVKIALAAIAAIATEADGL